MKTLRSVGLLLVALAMVGFGMGQLSNGNEVFAASLTAYCNTGSCEGLPCTTPSNARLLPEWCDSGMTISCAYCVDYTISNCLCNGGSDWCWDGDDKYYGAYRSCPPAR
jgi:hypothetical protein